MVELSIYEGSLILEVVEHEEYVFLVRRKEVGSVLNAILIVGWMIDDSRYGLMGLDSNPVNVVGTTVCNGLEDPCVLREGDVSRGSILNDGGCVGRFPTLVRISSITVLL